VLGGLFYYLKKKEKKTIDTCVDLLQGSEARNKGCIQILIFILELSPLINTKME
jgi:hypothetical protein